MAAPSDAHHVAREDVEAQLERILGSKQLSSSASLTKLLTFLVRSALEGRAPELKEYVIGVEVFERGEQFDPRIDSIVRVQSSKLRARLHDYYEQSGKDDPLIIEVPRGTYVPIWNPRTPNELPATKTHRFRAGRPVAMAIALLAAAVLSFMLWPKSDATPTLASPFRRFTTNPGLDTSPAISPDGSSVAYASDRSAGNLDIWVRQVSGGADRQITSGEADESEPTFSPDGKWIAYRSEAKEGGIYVVASLGGSPQRVAESGRRPRYSPDGKWIAYWSGFEMEGHLGGARSSGMYLVSPAGGPPRQLRPELLAARYPTWSPDGKHLLFVGVEMSDKPSPDWYVLDVASDHVSRMRVPEAFARAGIRSSVGRLAPGEWLNAGVLFSGRIGDSSNLWWLPMRGGFRWTIGEAVRLTSGTDTQVQPVVGRHDRDGTVPVAIAAWRENVDVWSYTDGRRPTAASRLTSDASRDGSGQLSPDSSKLAFLSDRSGATELWIKDIRSGTERMITSVGQPVGHFHFSADGLWIGFTTAEASRPIYRIAIDKARAVPPQRLCDQCGLVWHWSPDEQWIVHVAGLPVRFRLFDRGTGRRSDVLFHPSYQLYLPRISPDGKWLLFLARTGPDRSRVCVARLTPGSPPAEADWVTVVSDETWNDKPAWSEDGKAIYFTSDRDGFRCLWKQTFNLESKLPAGPPKPVFHSHAARVSIGNAFDALDLNVRGNTLVFEQGERHGSIWISKLKLPR